MMETNPQIELPHTRVICGRHGEPFRAEWPKGYALFCVNGLKAVMESESFTKECGGDVDLVNGLLDQKPICCRLSPDELVSLYESCGIGHLGTCAACYQEKMTVPIRDLNFWGRVRRTVRLCLQCSVQHTKPYGRG